MADDRKFKYRVREGFTYGANSQYGPGAIVELTAEEAKHSLDKLELAEIVHNVPSAATQMESAQMTADSTDSRSNSPETLDPEGQGKEDEPSSKGKSSATRKTKSEGD